MKKEWIFKNIITFSILLLCLCSISQADYNVHQKVIRFEKGKSSATLENSLVRGDTDHYIFSANSGQNIFINITSIEDNAVFSVYAPGYWLSAKDQIIEMS